MWHRPSGGHRGRGQDRPWRHRRRHRRRRRHDVGCPDRRQRATPEDLAGGKPREDLPGAGQGAVEGPAQPTGSCRSAEPRTADPTFHGRARRPDRAGVGGDPGVAGPACAEIAPAACRGIRARLLRRSRDALPWPCPRPEPAAGHDAREAVDPEACLRQGPSRHDDGRELDPVDGRSLGCAAGQ